MAIDREKVLAAAQKYVEKKKYDKAIIEYQKVIQEDPNDARTLLKIGDLQSKMEAYADADRAPTSGSGSSTRARASRSRRSRSTSRSARSSRKHVPQLEERTRTSRRSSPSSTSSSG